MQSKEKVDEEKDASAKEENSKVTLVDVIESTSDSQKNSDCFVMPDCVKDDGNYYDVRVTSVENPCSFYVQTQQQWEVCNENVINPLHNYVKVQPAEVSICY